MDQQNISNPQSNQTPEQPIGPLIRTMSKDIETLGEKPYEAPVAFQSPGYEPPPEMPLGMAPPIKESTSAETPMEIPVSPAETTSYPTQQIPPEPTAGMPPSPPSPPFPPSPPPPPPIAPGITETVISEKALTEFAPPQPPKKDIKKMALIAGIVGAGLVFGIAGWFLYPKIFPASTPLPTPPIIVPTPIIPTPTATPSPLPTPIVFFLKEPEKTVVLEIDAKTKTEIIADLKNELEQKETVGALKIIDLRQDGTPITFSQFANLIGLNFPSKLEELILPEFKLFINYHAQEGAKIGLILFVNDPLAAEAEIKNWENTTIDTDLANLFLEDDRGVKKAEFKSATYRGVNKRYLSFSKAPFSLDYGIYQNFLIITTSRFSFANAIDHILGEE